MPLHGPARPFPKAEQLPARREPRRTDASPEEKKRIREAKCVFCRLCGSPRSVNAHHLIPRSLGGRWHEHNIVGLDGSGTTGCHGLVEARDPAALAALRAKLTDDEYAYVVQVAGEGFLDRYYPAVPA